MLKRLFLVHTVLEAIALVNGQRMLVDLDAEVSNGSRPEWEYTSGEPVAHWDSQRGVDSEGEHGEWTYTLGASWTDKKSGAWVVTDVKLVVSDYYATQCPSGYNRVGFWDNDGSGGRDSFGNKAYYDMALCEKKEQCTAGREYVGKFIAYTSDRYDTPHTLNGASRIGYWDTQGWAWSAYTRNWGHHNIALYQQKYPCPIEPKCATVEIYNLEQVGVMISGLSGASVVAASELNNCEGKSTMSSTLVLHNEESVTESHQYTLGRSMANTFSTTVSSSVEVKVTSGFKPLGIGGEVEATTKLETSVTRGFSKTLSSSSSKMHSSSQSLFVEKRVEVTVGPGQRTVVSAKLDGFTFWTRFKATAYCLDKSGRRLETAAITGYFDGRSYKAGGDVKNKSVPCLETDSRRLMAPAEAHPDVMGQENAEEAF